MADQQAEIHSKIPPNFDTVSLKLYNSQTFAAENRDIDNEKNVRECYTLNEIPVLSEEQQAELFIKLDRYGFIQEEVEVNDPPIMKRIKLRRNNADYIASLDPRKEAERSLKWVKMLRKLEKRKLEDWSGIGKGIPDCLRGRVWNCALSNLEFNSEIPPIANLFSFKSSFENQIDLDINRTMRTHFQYYLRYGEGQRSLFRVLTAYSNYEKSVGYCQGMSTVVAFLLTYFDEEVNTTSIQFSHLFEI
ncbi:RabGAP/TBC [Rozella allomycis CSF55]|uniref:Rab-GTPase-TBC domain-containing protein n=1 Tax=Rozella allomycis (strain CSF55) TaxID=988480 RepID=A0A075B1E7_ROZAC|nr:Rab-GTPase-TBC domain-containing protein [Rozella allomycis CSF55]RKP21544.1 RabGAP/TBC [Rozella allomycis CSF55]|eukprot:EPZ34598.1 Rab-GTPase-TBC domain-containing protein [Rozella allomycis CSF55]